jgi:hypothetical protein
MCTVHNHLYDSKDNFFPNGKFPFFYGDVPLAPSYRAYFSQLVGFARICENVSDFSDCNFVIPNETVFVNY